MAIAMLVSVDACDGKHRFFYWVWVLIFWELENGYGDGPQRLIHNFYMVFANIFSVSGLRSASSYHPSFLQPPSLEAAKDILLCPNCLRNFKAKAVLGRLINHPASNTKAFA